MDAAHPETRQWLPWRYHRVATVNGPEDNTWENALRPGYGHTPPEFDSRVALWKGSDPAESWLRTGPIRPVVVCYECAFVILGHYRGWSIYRMVG